MGLVTWGQKAVSVGKVRHQRFGEKDRETGELCLDVLKIAIARLTDDEIRRMKDLDLFELARLSGFFSTRELMSYLRFMEHDKLEQTAFLTRRLCRQKVNAAYQQRGSTVPFPEDL